jgi:hypothetical protein
LDRAILLDERVRKWNGKLQNNFLVRYFLFLTKSYSNFVFILPLVVMSLSWSVHVREWVLFEKSQRKSNALDIKTKEKMIVIEEKKRERKDADVRQAAQDFEDCDYE